MADFASAFASELLKTRPYKPVPGWLILARKCAIFRTKHDQAGLDNTGLGDDMNRTHPFCHFGKLGCSPLDHNRTGINQRPRRYTRIRTIRPNPVLVISVVSAKEPLHA
jgi:hypothetical protein